MPSSADLLDTNVWLALAAEAHTHHRSAETYWQNEAAPLTAFCRMTQLAFLRHLTNKSVMATHTLTPAAAWKKVRRISVAAGSEAAHRTGRAGGTVRKVLRFGADLTEFVDGRLSGGVFQMCGFAVGDF